LPDPTAAPLPAVDYGFTGIALKMGLTLAVLLAVIYAAFWLLKRYGPKIGLGPGGRGGRLRLTDHLAVGPRKAVVVVRFLNKDLVLGVTEQSITLLTEAEHAAAPDFADTLAAKSTAGDHAP
jgi:flagellar protein FliO/FliZ